MTELTIQNVPMQYLGKNAGRRILDSGIVLGEMKDLFLFYCSQPYFLSTQVIIK